MTENKRHFHESLQPNNIICRSKALSGEELLASLLDLLKRHFPELDRDYAIREIMAREEIFPTVIAPGLAVPHARLPGLRFPLVALGTTPQSVDFNSPENSVKVMILVLTPLDEPNLHMQLFSALADDFRDSAAIDSVSQLSTQMM